MTTEGVRIKYGNFAPDAKENFFPESENSEFDTLSQLQRYNLFFPNYGNPCEEFQTLLDGKTSVLPKEPQEANIGFWSKELSENDGSFENPLVIEFVAQGKYSSQGINFRFDTYNGVFPTRLMIEWYRDGESIESSEFRPNSPDFLCEKQVEYYDKLVVTFYSLNVANTRLRLKSIDHGYGMWFEPNQLRGVKLIQEVNPISAEISINTTDFELELDVEGGVLFQRKQPLSIYYNGDLVSTSFVTEYKRASKKRWNIKSEDYIGLLNNIPYYGGIYTNTKAVDILRDIFSVAKIPYSIDSVFESFELTGYIPYTTCREALMQVAFAIQATVDTSNSEFVNIKPFVETISQSIPLDRIIQGQNFVVEDVVTSVEVTSHTYTPTNDTKEVYLATESGVGERIFVKFSEPLHTLEIVNGTFALNDKGEELKHSNYAVINAYEGCILSGKKYDHTTEIHRKNNPFVHANDFEKTISVENATLVSKNNFAAVLEKCYEYYTNKQTINARIVEAKHVQGGETVRYGQMKYGGIKYGAKTPKVITYDARTNAGEKIEMDTEFLGKKIGTIIKQTFNLNGGTVVKDSVIRGEAT